MIKRFYLLAVLLVISILPIHAQNVPLEIFAGHQSTTFDLLLIKHLKNNSDKTPRFLFFSRSRSIISNSESANAHLPQFSTTEALSYNHPSLKGFAPVAVVQIFNRGTFPKGGIQYLRLKPSFTFFGWFIIDLTHDQALDLFMLARYTPPITDKIKLYTQLELLNTFPTHDHAYLNLIQRTRLG
ncbi:MAG: hypothetical protein EBU52_03300, partial [Cytophagia bacterium]|nr:hypothetical protein [Cytophagia bacterium]